MRKPYWHCLQDTPRFQLFCASPLPPGPHTQLAPGPSRLPPCSCPSSRATLPSKLCRGFQRHPEPMGFRPAPTPPPRPRVPISPAGSGAPCGRLWLNCTCPARLTLTPLAPATLPVPAFPNTCLTYTIIYLFHSPFISQRWAIHPTEANVSLAHCYALGCGHGAGHAAGQGEANVCQGRHPRESLPRRWRRDASHTLPHPKHQACRASCSRTKPNPITNQPRNGDNL